MTFLECKNCKPKQTSEEVEASVAKLSKSENPETIFKVESQAGRGSYGIVNKCFGPNREKVAIKSMPHVTSKEKERNLIELGVLVQLRHRNIVQHIEAFIYDHRIFLVMEFLEGGTLSEVRGCWSEPLIASVAADVLFGLQFLHSKKVSYRDLKCSNVMMDVNGIIKLIDFGLCTPLPDGQVLTRMAGSAFWMAPEMVRHDGYAYPSDVWSFGCMVAELMLGAVPFRDKSDLWALYHLAAHATETIQPVLATTASTELKDFVGLCLQVDPSRRPDTTVLLAHRFLAARADEAAMRNFAGHAFAAGNLAQAMPFL